MPRSFVLSMRSDWMSGVSILLILSELLSVSAFADRACPPRSVLHGYVQRLRGQMPPRATAHGPTTGIEIEGVIPRSVGIAGARDHLVRFLEVRGWRVSTHVLPTELPSFEIRAVNEGREMVWKVGRDASIHPARSSQMGIEIASPVLSWSEDTDLFLDATASLRSIGMRSEPLSAGVHVHVGLPDPTPEEIRDLNLIMARVGESLASTFSQSSSREFYARAIDRFVAETADSMGTLDWLQHIGKRYRHLNLQALTLHGTVEFRLFNSTMDRNALVLMQSFCRDLVQAVRNQDLRIVVLLERQGATVDFEELARALGHDPATYQGALARLTKEARNAQWGRRIQGGIQSARDLAPLFIISAVVVGWATYGLVQIGRALHGAYERERLDREELETERMDRESLMDEELYRVH